MSFLTGSQSGSARPSRSTRSSSRSKRRVRLAARALRLRQDDHAASDRRLRAAGRRADPDRRRGRGGQAAVPARRQHRLSVLRAVSASAGARQRRLRPSPPRPRQGPSASSARVRCSRSSGWRTSSGAGRASSRGASSSGCALARALVMNPKVLLLDEPLGALDLSVRKQLQIELKRIQSEVGVTFIYVTHDQDEALAMSDRVAVMNEGRIEQIGTPGEIYDYPGFGVRRLASSATPTSSAATARRSPCAPSACRSRGAGRGRGRGWTAR